MKWVSRWEEILAGTTERLVEAEKFMMGCEMRVGSQVRDNYTFTDEIETKELPGHQAIREIVALCEQKGIQPVFVALPGHASNQEQMNMNSVAPLCEELGVPQAQVFKTAVQEFLVKHPEQKAED